jgi:hypothetical protein
MATVCDNQSFFLHCVFVFAAVLYSIFQFLVDSFQIPHCVEQNQTMQQEAKS